MCASYAELKISGLQHGLKMTSESLKYVVKITGTGAIIASLVFIGLQSLQAESIASLPDPLEAGWKDAPVCERLFEDRRQRILRCEFPPGVGHERHFHVPHFGYALAGGRMRITDDSGVREMDLATGSSYASDGVAWHEVMNIGETTTTFLIVEPK